jgi:1-acyl-sn-glycerol-3-phosphate acyltransferase
VTTIYGYAFFRVRAIEVENVPVSGPVIIAPNHFSFMDHFFVGMATRRKIRFMAKSQLFTPPLQWIYRHGGVFPVRRGHRDEEAFITAETVLERGETVTMYPEAGRSRTGKLSDKARPGIGRLALETGAPVVPSAIAGSANVRNWKKLQFPKVTVQYGDPIRFEKVENPTKEQAQAASEVIFAGIEKLYYGLQQEGRKSAVQAARAARRAAKNAAESAARRPTTS